MKHIAPFIEENLFLRINGDKTIIVHADNIKFLGYGFFKTPDGYRIKIHEDSIARMKERAASLSDNPDKTRVTQYITSWLTHYRLANTAKFLDDMNSSPK